MIWRLKKRVIMGSKIKLDHDKLFATMPIPRMIISPCSEQKYIVSQINAAALNYFGFEQDKILDHDIQDFLNAEHVQHFQQTFEVCIETKRLVSIKALPGVPGQKRIYSFLVSPVVDDNQNVVFLDVLGQPDAIDQSMLQRERDDALSMLTSVFDVSEIGILVTNEQAQIVRVNEAFTRSYGWGKDDLLNTDMGSLVTPDEREEARTKHAERIRTGERASGEMKFIRKDGNIANVLYTAATLELSQRRRFQVITIMDITLRKRMELSLRMAKEQADAANQAKSTFLANMSHELRTPLNAIIGFSEMIIGETFGKLGDPKYVEYLGDIHMSAKLLLDIINEVLDMSKIEAGRLELDEEIVDLRKQIQSAERMIASKAFGQSQDIHLEIEDDLPMVRADTRLIRQILINVMTNAVKFSKDGDAIYVRAYLNPSEGEVCIEIEDQGVGIPREKIGEALQPFAQVLDNAHVAQKQGTGLGLPLAKAMIDMHGGHLELQSDEGQGTKVIISLPAFRVIT